ncbi:MAG: methyl-accepting chemotaxis protein [Defluviitaleaceae bacterium]|nr:methyl-accepting chemotaxis protein [Defluviitaleaceae bacterium]MCL2261758.1 methyl-accepting chemotaxis protein [Defluviitaleaceae bacterium]
MNFRTIGTKLFLVSLVSIVLMSVAFIILMLNGSRQISRQLSRQHMDLSVSTVHSAIAQIKESTGMMASQFANNSAIATGVQTDNAAAILGQVSTAMAQQVTSGSYFVVVTDNYGRVVARSLGGVSGDFVSQRPAVAFALNEVSTSDIDFHGETPLSIVSAAPIIGFGGSILGSVVVGYDIASQSFVNLLRDTTGSEITVFLHDTSIATTISGSYAVGSQIENLPGYRAIAHREFVIMEKTIQGESFLAYYEPIMTADGVIVGVLFLGRNLSEVRAAEMAMMMTAIVAAVVIAAVALLVSGRLNSRMIVAPVKKLSRDLTYVANGNLDININRANLSQDEIGSLANDVYGVVEVIKGMSDDVSELYNQYAVVGDTDYRIDERKYQNTYRDMMADVNKIMVDLIENISVSLDALSKISHGDFDVQVEDMPGKRMVLPKTIREVAQSLNDLNNELGVTIKSVVNGELSNRIDTHKYKGEWHKIMAGLNDITKAVDEPLRVIDIAVRELKEGNFNLVDIDKKISAKGLDADASRYNGMFGEILTTFETSIGSVDSYINEIKTVLAKMAEGDMRSNITRSYVGSFDLIKTSVNDIATTLHKTMSEISSAADQVLQGASQISSSASDLSNGAQNQASSVQELTATIGMISQQTNENAANADIANELSGKSTVTANEGNEAVMHMVDAMNQIKESSSDISKIVKTIQDIAFQTNLLALNASVEAARAGEHGKGFAVVADEVRTLAGRSQEAATQTTTLIQESITRVESGSSIAASTTESLDSIVDSASKVLEVMGKISAASKEQAESIADVSDGLEQISRVTQNNSAVSEQTAAASQELNSQAEVLQQLVAFFKL